MEKKDTIQEHNEKVVREVALSIDSVVRQALTKAEQRGAEKERERILQLPHYDLSDNGISGDRYIRAEDIQNLNPPTK